MCWLRPPTRRLPLLIVEPSPVTDSPAAHATETTAEPAVDPEVLDRWRSAIAANMDHYNRACFGSEVLSVGCDGPLRAFQMTHPNFTQGSDSDRLEWVRHNPRTPCPNRGASCTTAAIHAARNRLAVRAGLPLRYGPWTPVSDGAPEVVPDPVEGDASSGT